MRPRSLLLVLAGFAAVFGQAPPAEAVVYCQYVNVPVGCVARRGVVLRPAPAVRVAPRVVTPGVGAPGPGVRPGTPMNRGGPVNRGGRR